MSGDEFEELEDLPEGYWADVHDRLPQGGRVRPDRKYEQTETAVVVMRHLRKLARSQSYVRKTEVVRLSIDYQTGEVKMRKRKVNRRHQYLANQTHGYLAVNDGVEAARDISRLLGATPPDRQREFDLVA